MPEVRVEPQHRALLAGLGGRRPGRRVPGMCPDAGRTDGGAARVGDLILVGVARACPSREVHPAIMGLAADAASVLNRGAALGNGGSSERPEDARGIQRNHVDDRVSQCVTLCQIENHSTGRSGCVHRIPGNSCPTNQHVSALRAVIGAGNLLRATCPPSWTKTCSTGSGPGRRESVPTWRCSSGGSLLGSARPMVCHTPRR